MWIYEGYTCHFVIIWIWAPKGIFYSVLSFYFSQYLVLKSPRCKFSVMREQVSHPEKDVIKRFQVVDRRTKNYELDDVKRSSNLMCSWEVKEDVRKFWARSTLQLCSYLQPVYSISLVDWCWMRVFASQPGTWRITHSVLWSSRILKSSVHEFYRLGSEHKNDITLRIWRILKLKMCLYNVFI